MTPARAASLTGILIVGAVGLLLWIAAGDDPVAADDRLQQLLAGTLLLGTPLALAGAAVARRVARVGGRDGPERLLRLTTAGLRDPRAAWGTAMRAELASIDGRAERRRFALGCAGAACRAGIGPETWLAGLGVGIVVALGTLAASRVSLASDRAGVMALAIVRPPIVLAAVTLATAYVTGSFRSALTAGAFASLGALVGFVAVAMVEAVRWFEVAGAYVMDGDAPKGGVALTGTDAIWDPVAPFFLLVFLLVWTPWPVLGAAAGSWLRRWETRLGAGDGRPAAHPPAPGDALQRR